jgi:hypothetical protein
MRAISVSPYCCTVDPEPCMQYTLRCAGCQAVLAQLLEPPGSWPAPITASLKLTQTVSPNDSRCLKSPAVKAKVTSSAYVRVSLSMALHGGCCPLHLGGSSEEGSTVSVATQVTCHSISKPRPLGIRDQALGQ